MRGARRAAANRRRDAARPEWKTPVFLKKLVLHGFKSFADRTAFEFGPGMTGVVGPNGCGKSNVLDAMRWVLGEQSAKTLRGSKMLDVVFSGSRTRKPSNYAEVELTFDNSTGFLDCDEREVTVGRILYASGDSEYRINGNAARLRDVRDLFLDTGVGVDAYSVIEQGRVDAMLRANPTQRRELFEEAAGISRYQVRRAEAQRKLERSQNNLLRLQDVLDELERRLRSVKLAAGKARNFQEYDQRLRELRSAHALAEFHSLKLNGRAMNARLRGLQDVVRAWRLDLSARDEVAAVLERERQVLDERIEAAEAESRRVEGAFSTMEERVRQSELRLEELRAARVRQLEEAERAAERLSSLTARVEEEEVELQRLEQLAAEEAAGVEELRATRDRVQQQQQEAGSALEAQRQAAFEAARRISLLQTEVANLASQVERIAASLAEVNERRAALELRRQELAGSQAQLAERVESLSEACDERTRRLGEREATLEELEKTQQKLADAFTELKERRSGVDSRLSLLEDLESRQEGIAETTRALLALRDDPDFPHVLGLVADVLRIDDPRITLLEPVLRRFEQSVLVDDAARFLSALEQRGGMSGQVSVLALDRVSVDEHGLRYHGAPGVVARAVDWVRCEPCFGNLAERLLGRVIVVEDRARALALAGSAGDGYLFVSLDGYLVETDGRVTFGLRQEATGLISRKAEIRRLRSERDDVETQLERTARQRREYEQRLSDARLDREALLREIATVQRQHAEVRTEWARAKDALERVESERDQLAGEAESLETTRREAVARTAELTAAEEAGRRDHAEREAALRGGEQQTTALGAELERLNQSLTERQIASGRTAERRAARAGVLEDLRRQCQQAGSQREQLLHEAAAADEKETIAEREIEASQRQAGELRAQVAAQAEVLRGLLEDRGRQRRKLESSSGLIRRMHAEIEAGESMLHDLDVRLHEQGVRRENLVTRIHDDLGVSLESLYEDYEHAQRDWDAVAEEIETLRTKIQRLGNVNMDALAELEELTPRFENLSAQREDVLESVEQLQKLIEELDEESTRRFAACFEEVRKNFQELFRKVFGGGKADVYLEDPENPLETGIEIIARPPGKEPQSLSLLSGGEKTMAAVALLFAVFKRKPSPFAILDEVDAALDESNIGRFNNVLLEFLEQSQFIVITHSKRTMQCADVLYGVTMEEPGVSKRVSVRFDNGVETPNVA